jgi:hypothetical protein
VQNWIGSQKIWDKKFEWKYHSMAQKLYNTKFAIANMTDMDANDN